MNALTSEDNTVTIIFHIDSVGNSACAPDQLILTQSNSATTDGTSLTSLISIVSFSFQAFLRSSKSLPMSPNFLSSSWNLLSITQPTFPNASCNSCVVTFDGSELLSSTTLRQCTRVIGTSGDYYVSLVCLSQRRRVGMIKWNNKRLGSQPQEEDTQEAKNVRQSGVYRLHFSCIDTCTCPLTQTQVHFQITHRHTHRYKQRHTVNETSHN